MTSEGFLSTASVVVILAICVALLAMASASVLAPLDRLTRRRVGVFAFCLVCVWALAVLVIWLIRRTI